MYILVHLFTDQLLSPQGGEIEWETLAQTFELTGGLIRNAVLSAISLASKKTLTDDTIHLTFEDLYNGAKQQLRFVGVLFRELVLYITPSLS